MVDSNKISTFLSKTKDQIGFEQRIQTKAVNTQKTSQSAVRNFEGFCKKSYDKSMEEEEEEGKVIHDKVNKKKKFWKKN